MEPDTRYTVIGAVVLALVGAAIFGFLWLSSTGHDSPGGTRPVLASRVSDSWLPGFGPKRIEALRDLVPEPT